MAKPNYTFEQALKRFISATKSGMRYAEMCAIMAITHFAEHGNLSQCQQFYDAMGNQGKNYVRRDAFMRWLIAFAPVKMENGKFAVDKSRGKFSETDLVGAKKKTFWDHKPIKEVQDFSADDIITAFRRDIKRFTSDKYVPLDNAAKLRLAQAEAMIEELENKPLPVAEKASEEDQPAQKVA